MIGCQITPSRIDTFIFQAKDTLLDYEKKDGIWKRTMTDTIQETDVKIVEYLNYQQIHQVPYH